MSEHITQSDWQRALPDLERAGSQLQGPCPLCGGTDRFYVLDSGKAYCRQCLPDGEDVDRFLELLAAVFGTHPRASRSRPSTPSKKPEIEVITGDEFMQLVQPITPTKPKLPINNEGWLSAIAGVQAEFRYNERAQRAELRRHRNPDWTTLTDQDEARVKVDIENAFDNLSNRSGDHSWRVSLERWTTFRNAELSRHRVDPFIVDYLANLPPATDKGHEMLDRWLFDVFNWQSPDELVKWVSRYIFLAPVQRAYEPGCKLDEIPVLVGPQGCGKSALVGSVMREEEWFTDAVDLAADDKTLIEATLGRVVCEIPEMAGASARLLSRIKAWTTRRDDGAIRLAYARHPVETPRRFVAIGTANGECLPNDESGNRRWVCIETRDRRAKMKPESFMALWRDELFSAALEAFKCTDNANLPHELADMQALTNLAYRKRDMNIEDHVAEFLDRQDGPIRLQRVLDEVRQRMDAAPNQRAVIAAMRSNGWDRNRSNSSRLWSRE